MTFLRRLHPSNNVTPTLTTRTNNNMKRYHTTRRATLTRIRIPTTQAQHTQDPHYYHSLNHNHTNFLNLLNHLKLLRDPFTLNSIRFFTNRLVVRLLLTRLILVLLLHGIIIMLLLHLHILSLLFLRLLIPNHVHAIYLVNAIIHMSIMPNIRRQPHRQTRTHNTKRHSLRHITSRTRRHSHVIRPLLLLNDDLLLLHNMITVRNIRATRMILVLTMILLVNHIMNITRLFRPNMVIQGFLLVPPLHILLLHIRLIRLKSRYVTTTIMNIRHRLVRHQSNLVRHPSLLLMNLLNRTNHVTKTMTAHRHNNLYNDVNTNIINILNMHLHVLLMRQILHMIMIRHSPHIRIIRNTISLILVPTLMITKNDTLLHLRNHFHFHRLLEKLVPHQHRYVLRLLTTIRPLNKMILFLITYREISFLATISTT